MTRLIPGAAAAAHAGRITLVTLAGRAAPVTMIALAGLATLAMPAQAQQAATAAPPAATGSAFELSVANIMRGPEHVGSGPSGVQFTADSRWIYFRWTPGGQAWDASSSSWRVPAAGGTPEELSPGAADSAAILLASGPLGPDGYTRAVSVGGDLYFVDTRDGTHRRLTETRASEGSPVWGPEGRTLYYTSGDDVYAFDVSGGAIRQVTDVRTGPDPRAAEERAPEGQKGFLVQQQRELFEHIRRAVEQREERQAEARARAEAEPKQPTYLERDEQLGNLQIEPHGRYALISTRRSGGGGGTSSVDMPQWITESGYTETRSIRSKVGDTGGGPNGRLGVLDLASGAVRWVDVAAHVLPAGAEEREVGARFGGWNDAGTHALISVSADDFKDGWLLTMDAGTGALTTVAHENQQAWVAGPCSITGCNGWLPESGTLYYTSEKDGFNHLYTVQADGTGERQLTRGDWEVYRVWIPEGAERFYLQTNQGTPHQQHVWTMAFDGSRKTQLTDMVGHQSVTVSPDRRRLAIVHSAANRPEELYVAANEAPARVTRVTTSPTEEWLSFPWLKPEIIQFRASDGVMVPARVYRPEDVGARPNGAAVLFVHGAGYLQNVHEWWSSYYREYMFHHILAARGYMVVDVDYRGSQGYGAEWRTAIYRHMGGRDLQDFVDASRWLEAQHGIDPERIGIYGGSYGGFITLMALFNEPEHFGAGAALRSVTDWAHYNHGYTGRILNLPQDDTLSYKQSSPIYFAEGLEDPLLIAHGMVDSNVHFSDVVRLAQRLIELGKEDWEMAVYPVESHGFAEPTSWTDEYRRILELFDRALHPGGRAADGG